MTLGHFQLTPPKGGPRCIFCEYSERVSREPRSSSFFFPFSTLMIFNKHMIKKLTCTFGNQSAMRASYWKHTCFFVRLNRIFSHILGFANPLNQNCVFWKTKCPCNNIWKSKKVCLPLFKCCTNIRLFKQKYGVILWNVNILSFPFCKNSNFGYEVSSKRRLGSAMFTTTFILVTHVRLP